MLKFLNKLNKRGIILVSVLSFLSLVIVLIFFLRTDFSVKNFIAKNSQLLAQATPEIKLETVPYFFPRFPQRLISHLSEMETITEELVEFNEKLNNQLRECNCRNALSQCLPRIAFGGQGCTPGKVLGQPCLELGEIETYKEEIADRIDNLSYLRELLIKEMEGGLEAELKTLRPEVAEELRNKLNEVLGKSEKILLTAKENRNLYSQDYTKKCIASCQAGQIQGIKACLQLASAPQKHIEIKAKIRVGVDDLDLGEVGIEEFKLSLPEKLQFPKLGDITLTIPRQSISVCFPFEPITLSVEPPSLPTLPTLSFGCPKLPRLSSKPPELPMVNETVETGEGINWYFKILSWLMEKCSKLPTMSGKWGLKEKAADCYNPEKVISTIVKECDTAWDNYCMPDPGTLVSEPPVICKKIRFSCQQNGKIAPALQCQNLFKQKGETIPSSCTYKTRTDPETGKIIYIFPPDFDPVGTLKNKCQELKDQGEKEIPEPCKILLLFSGKIEDPESETYSPSEKISLPAQKLFNVPFGFGSGLGYNCPLNLPSLPKITLPDIIIPDIDLPEFNIRPFLEVKLPDVIFEDIILPDIELCDLNNCSFVFPSLNFQFPRLNLPSFDYSAPIPQLPGLNLRLGFDFPSINFSLPQLNLFNLALPELELPKISLPSPEIDFDITGIDLGSIFELIFSFVINAVKMPDLGGCFTARFTLPLPLSIIFPDYYFSFIRVPKIPEIPFCEDIRQFCDKAKNALGTGGWLKKAKEIEREFNKTIGKIQKEIDKISEPLNEGLRNQMDQIFKEYGQIIYEEMLKQLQKKGLSVEDYINPKTRQLELDKIPFPGVFPVGEIDKRECLPLSLPETKIILRIVEKKNLPAKTVERQGRQIIVYLPLNVASEIPIPWPEKLKKIKLTNPLTYQLPKIPLDDLGFEREFSIKGPGFQPIKFDFDFGKTGEGDCLAKPPTGGNPFPIGQITGKLNEIKNLQGELKSNSQAIIRILE